MLDRYIRPADGTGLHLVVDLGDVRSFGAGGLRVIRRAASASTRSSTSLHLTGVAARLDALPPHIGASLVDLSCFPTLEDALDALRAGPPIAAVDRIDDARQRHRGPQRIDMHHDHGVSAAPGRRPVSELASEPWTQRLAQRRPCAGEGVR